MERNRRPFLKHAGTRRSLLQRGRRVLFFALCGLFSVDPLLADGASQNGPAALFVSVVPKMDSRRKMPWLRMAKRAAAHVGNVRLALIEPVKEGEIVAGLAARTNGMSSSLSSDRV
jgi:hypothetical protein